MTDLDHTHNPATLSWVESANGHRDFPVQNLPLGVVQHHGVPVIATAIGDECLLLPLAVAAGWGSGLALELRQAMATPTLNALAALDPVNWTALRYALFDALTSASAAATLQSAMIPLRGITSLLPFTIGDYTDFYASVHHATNVGSMFRPDEPLLPNYKWIPIGYHGRASSIVPSDTNIRRPVGQLRPAGAEPPPVVATRSLDYELELGLFIGGENALGTTVPVGDAASRLFGCVILNDWSARDMQAWEYQPLGPFLAKNFASTISPWVVTADALRPFQVPMPERPVTDPPPLPYLSTGEGAWSYRITLEVWLRSEAMRATGVGATQFAKVDYSEAMYWSPTQLIAHHGSNGCNLRPGDLLGSGTVSGPGPEARGCLLELTWRGRDPVRLGEETRAFLADGDEVTMLGGCQADGRVPIGFGACRGVILPA